MEVNSSYSADYELLVNMLAEMVISYMSQNSIKENSKNKETDYKGGTE